MEDFNLNGWLDDTAQMIANELRDTDPNEYGDAFYEMLHEEVDRAVIYYSPAMAIIREVGFFNGYKDHELAPFDNISQIAYAGLYDEAISRMDAIVHDGEKFIRVITGDRFEEFSANE